MKTQPKWCRERQTWGSWRKGKGKELLSCSERKRGLSGCCSTRGTCWTRQRACKSQCPRSLTEEWYMGSIWKKIWNTEDMIMIGKCRARRNEFHCKSGEFLRSMLESVRTEKKHFLWSVSKRSKQAVLLGYTCYSSVLFILGPRCLQLWWKFRL